MWFKRRCVPYTQRKVIVLGDSVRDRQRRCGLAVSKRSGNCVVGATGRDGDDVIPSAVGDVG